MEEKANQLLNDKWKKIVLAQRFIELPSTSATGEPQRLVQLA